MLRIIRRIVIFRVIYRIKSQKRVQKKAKKVLKKIRVTIKKAKKTMKAAKKASQSSQKGFEIEGCRQEGCRRLQKSTKG
jgi:hypothetical protein